ncbi:MAG: ABC transporter ATP-binding protein [Mesorhizobium sp.]|uniref:ABC transporter ATP-binding protein n=1 Tax=Mesorhizobium sp. TaxID=1871066 RepID=UPI000FE4ABC7|nr:ABC transporter ATP-binding protein [Mesorhizobium sp.]RWO51832.1 MAG: ABC transporter ATP-binding protein [Mesorhizobium sp.]RWO84043.1 MAG: ABC transporter ATP-binding protein [Mesorhizobium sp.]TIN38347.1 MAG: ABC transporter ATP-binding protein [Mesorhizobium sp.]TJU82882.1 MAG: ABC transporter ATP-binding protein [Mesorhizobium sp.]TJU89213.1 MAG: ABC transporter ATP-binding protein [Mesorhizobium sp.]
MLLSIEDLLKSYSGPEGPVPVLRGVTLSLDAGETLALTGESGSGKSTLLHLVAGLDAADGGRVGLDGQEVTALDDSGRARLRRSTVGIIFQQFNLIPSLDVAANIAFQARLIGTPEPQELSRLAHALGLEPQLRKYPEQLSGGQQQRVAIARALAARPKLILADEPTGNLDEATADGVMEQFLALVAETGAALLMVTHSPRLAARLGRRAHLSQGRLA